MSPKIIDASIYNRELEMFATRIKYLHSHVDKFYLISGTHTFTGIRNSDYEFKEEKKIAKKFNANLEILEINFTKRLNWNIHRYILYRRLHNYSAKLQRRLGLDVIRRNSNPDDILIFSDIDEIPSRQKIDELIRSANDIKPKRLLMHMSCYSFNNIAKFNWAGSYISKVRDASSSLIRSNDIPNTSKHSGWHFTYMGGDLEIKKKLIAFDHPEFAKKALSSWDESLNMMRTGADLFGRNKYQYELASDNLLNSIYDPEILSLVKNNPFYNFRD